MGNFISFGENILRDNCTNEVLFDCAYKATRRESTGNFFQTQNVDAFY